jgi:Fic-DOC domain mobile mystery protein B
VALIGETVEGETPLTEDDLQGLKLPFVRTRSQLSEVEGANIINGKEWALSSRHSGFPDVISIEYMQELHRRMLGDVWEWAGQIRVTKLQNAFASSVSNIRPELLGLYKDAVEHWLKDEGMSRDEFAVRVHHRVVKIHPFRNGNGRHSRLLADVILEKNFGLTPLSWGGNADLGNSDPNRGIYLTALKAADRGDYASLMKLCRSA